jgi:hypothetical protein
MLERISKRLLCINPSNTIVPLIVLSKPPRACIMMQEPMISCPTGMAAASEHERMHVAASGHSGTAFPLVSASFYIILVVEWLFRTSKSTTPREVIKLI